MSNHSETMQTFFLIFSILLMIVLFLLKYLHESPLLNSILSEPAMTLLVGMSFSFVVSIFFVLEEAPYNGNGNTEEDVEKDLADSLLSFQTRVFFLALLPPILFNSGYQLQRELFYRHFGPISLFACVGTCVSALCTGTLLVFLHKFRLFGNFNPKAIELFTFGSLIAATDTVSVVGIFQAKKVDPHLFSLVFGESALNDAVSLVLFKSLSTFLIQDAFGDHTTLLAAVIKFICHLFVQATCSPLLGMLFATCMGYAFKVVDLREHRMLELSLYIMPMYIPFILSEAMELSGMIAIFFTGIFAKRYMEPNVSDSTKQHAEMLFKLLAFLAETCIFLELGLSVFGLSGKFEWRFIGWALIAALLGRAASIYPLAAFYNLSLTKSVMCDCSDDTSILTDQDFSVTSATSKEGSVAASSVASWLTQRETPVARRDKQIPVNFMHMLTFAGLRGAVAYACARDFPNLYGRADKFVAATMAIVVVTIVVMGGATEHLMERLRIRSGVDETEYMRDWHTKRKLKGRFHRFEYHFIYRNVVRQASYKMQDISERSVDLCSTPVVANCTSPFDYTKAFDDYDGGFPEDKWLHRLPQHSLMSMDSANAAIDARHGVTKTSYAHLLIPATSGDGSSNVFNYRRARNTESVDSTSKDSLPICEKTRMPQAGYPQPTVPAAEGFQTEAASPSTTAEPSQNAHDATLLHPLDNSGQPSPPHPPPMTPP